jgi:hypothetical protein
MCEISILDGLRFGFGFMLAALGAAACVLLILGIIVGLGWAKEMMG